MRTGEPVRAEVGARDVPPPGVGGLLALFREAFWVRALLLVVVLSAVFVVLGRWQWARHVDKTRRDDRVAVNYAAAPVPLAQVLAAPGDPLPPAAVWRPVVVEGRYDPAGTLLVRNRPLDGQGGYEVLVPLRTASGAVFLVDRGWVPQGASSQRPDAVPAPPPGDVEVVARLQPSEPGTDRTPPPGQVWRIDVPAVARALGVPAYAAYGRLARETPAPATAPAPLPEPEASVGINLAYALQWWGFAVAAYVLLLRYMVRELRRRRGELPDGAVRPAEAARPSRRRRPTDEEWEDAADR